MSTKANRSIIGRNTLSTRATLCAEIITGDVREVTDLILKQQFSKAFVDGWLT